MNDLLATTALEPALSFAPELLLRAQGVKVAFFDVDGVLTDGGLYFSEYPDGHKRAATQGGFRSAGEIIKRFNTLDGHGLKLLQKAGITPVVITGRDSAVLRARLQALGIEHAHFGTEDKRPAAELTLQTLGLDWSAAAAMGDDWPDLPVMNRAAFSCAPANAHTEVKARAHHVTPSTGGHGAAREFCDLLLVASGCYASLLREYSE
ncbi:MAG: KdsC family phosphatase [Polaromonas sp.]